MQEVIMKKDFSLTAYKPNSSDYCRGCEMASYDSDFIFVDGLDEKELIEKLADVLHQNMNMRCNEWGYSRIFISQSGIRIWDNDAPIYIAYDNMDLAQEEEINKGIAILGASIYESANAEASRKQELQVKLKNEKAEIKKMINNLVEE